MSKPASKTLIGAFVLGAIALAVAAVLILGAGKFFTNKTRFILYFDGTIEGLTVGSPVMFRGVKIGTVTDIGIRFNAENLSFLIPVIIELSGAPLEGIKASNDKNTEYYMKLLISKGLKAQLEVRSIVTGQLAVNLDLFPNKHGKLYQISKKHMEIPTIPMGLEEIAKTLLDIPYKELFDKIDRTIEGISRIVNSADMTGSMKALHEGLNESVKISKTINAQLEPTIISLRETSNTMRSTFEHAEKALSGKDGVPEQIKETLKATRSALAQAEQTLIFAQKHLGENSIVMQEVDNTMEEIAKTARSIRFLTEYLQTHPESVISGKKQ
jgi:paraquat-inducible protein B